MTHNVGLPGQVTHFKTVPIEAGKIKAVDKIDGAMADEIAAHGKAQLWFCASDVSSNSILSYHVSFKTMVVKFPGNLYRFFLSYQ